MEVGRRILQTMLVLSIFTFIVAVTSLYVQMQMQNLGACTIPLPLFIPFIACLGLFIGTLIYSLMAPVKVKGIDVDAICKLLEADEAKVIKAILTHEDITQAKISKITKLNKVRVFRILERLERRGVIKKVKRGKTNRILLSEEIRKAMGLAK